MIKKNLINIVKSLQNYKGYGFKGALTIFQKEREESLIKKAVDQINNENPILKLEKITDKDLKFKEEIKKFDFYYKEFYLNCSANTEKNNKVQKQKLMKFIYEILEQKVGNDYKKIQFFLVKRGQNLTNIEVLFFLTKIADLKHISKFKAENPELFLLILKTVKENFPLNTELTSDFIKIFKTWEVKDTMIISILLKNLSISLKNLQNLDKKISTVQNYLEIFRMILGESLNKPELEEKVLKISSFFFKNLRLLNFEEVYGLFLDLNTHNVVINYNNLDLLDEYFFEIKEKVPLEKGINILYYFIKNKFHKSSFIDYLSAFFKQNDQENKKPFEKLPISATSKLVWSISQIDSMHWDVITWENIEKHVLNSLETQNISIKDIAPIIQGINYAKKGSKNFWCFFTFEKVIKFNLNFNEIFVIAMNQQKFYVFDLEFLKYFMNFFQDRTNFKFINDLKDEQLFSFFRVFIMIFHKALNTLKKKESEDYYQFINEIFIQVTGKYFSQDLQYKKLLLNDQISLYKLIKLLFLLFDGFHIKLNKEAVIFTQKLEKKIIKNLEKINLEKMIKLLIFLDYIENKKNIRDFEIFDQISEKIPQILIKNNDFSYLYLIPILWKFKYFESKIWCILQIKFIESFDFLMDEGLIIPILIFNKLEKKKIIPPNNSFWNLISHNLEMKKLLENELLSKILSENLGKKLIIKEEINNKKDENFSNLKNEEFLIQCENFYQFKIDELKNEKGIDVQETENLFDLFI